MRRCAIPVLSILLLIGAAVPASASAPIIERTQIDDTMLFPAGTRCDFEVQAARTGVFTTKVWVDDHGTPVREVWSWSPGSITYTNPATGASVTTVLAGPVIIDYLDDGTALGTINGNDQHVTTPGQGFLGGDIGHEVARYDLLAGMVLEVLVSVGQQDSTWPAGCAALG